MFQPVTKWSHSILNADTIPEVMRKAIRLARTEKPGAVLIELPEDVAKHETDAVPLEPRRFRRPVVDEKIFNQAFTLLKSAKKPVIIAGNGAIRKRAAKQLRHFCEQTNIGVLNTFMAKGAVDLDADYCLYTIGLGRKDLPTLVIDDADLIITLGFDMVEYHPQLWNPSKDKQIIHADFLPAEIDEYYHPSVELVGDLAHTLWMFNERLKEDNTFKFDLSYQAEMRERMQAELSKHAEDDAKQTIKPQKMLWDIRALLKPEDIVLSDVGAHKMWIARHYHCHEPNTCLIPNGFCSMGFALPGAIAASMVYPDRHILAIAGDAGFLMNVQEMETAKRINANCVVLVWEDNAYGLIAWKQEDEFGKHTDLSFQNPDWLQLASSFGWHGHKVTDSDQFKSVLEAALDESGPSLVVATVDYSENKKLTERLGELTQPS